MDVHFVPVFASVCVFLTTFDFYYSFKSFHEVEKIGRSIGLSSASAGIVILAYLYSILSKDYLQVSISSSIYFLMIDWMLIFVLHFVYLFTGLHLLRKRWSKVLHFAVVIYAVFDTLVLIINIFREIAVHYVQRETVIAHYSYQMMPLYIMHLIFTYILVVVALCLLIRKCILTPSQYRNQYLWIIAAIAIVVVINALFLYAKSNRSYSIVDYSILVYSVGIYLMYWAAFIYRKNDMLKALSMTIFENIGQGIVLFDHTDRLIMRNKKAEQLLSGLEFNDEMTSRELLDLCQIPEEVRSKKEYSVQCQRPGSALQPIQCDFRQLHDRRGRITGKLFVLSDETNENDLLTGFQHWQIFLRFARENPYHFQHPTSVVIFDIVGLGKINRLHGRDVGDGQIRNLSQVIRRNMPPDSYFVRGYEAHLIAICGNHSEAEMKKHVDAILSICGDAVIYGMSATTSRTHAEASREKRGRDGDMLASTILQPENYDIVQCIETASHALQVKKLLSAKSAHSQTLSSLVRALQESDSDTEAHVQRTQRMGRALGERIGFSDVQLADLDLLCLLHDIGKIGIPLEILNKPGKLTDSEWMVLHTHAEKGYQIAMSSDELRDIAMMIRCHHERWDGKGYPDKLAGQSIPVLSRVISVVDSYDAMVNNRSYRKGLTPEEAKEEIRRNAGTQFDPYLAEEFLRMLEENPDIARGESTGGEVVRSFIETAMQTVETGSTYPISCSRYLLDLDDTIIEVDDHFEKITGYPSASAVGRMSQLGLIPEEDRSYYMIQVNNQYSKGTFAYLRHNIRRQNGEIIRVVCYGKRYYDSVDKAFRSEIIIFPVDEMMPEL